MQIQEIAKKPIKIVMVDKEQKLLLVTKKYFLNKRIHIKTASTLDKAWEFLHKSCPDLVIIDTIISNASGEDFIHVLQQDKKLKHIPIIILTARGLTEDRIKGYKFGCSIYLSKPFDPEELECIIHNIVEKKRVSLGWITQMNSIIRECKNVLSLKQVSVTQAKTYIQLTKKEKLILIHLLAGMLTHEIATNLKTTDRHIENYITRLLDKTRTKNTTELKKISWYKML